MSSVPVSEVEFLGFALGDCSVDLDQTSVKYLRVVHGTALELAVHDRTYEEMVVKFVEHFYLIAAAMNKPGPDTMWDEEDGFYYDLLRLPDGSATRLKVRSMVGLLPLCATTVVEKWQRERLPNVMAATQDLPHAPTRLRRPPAPPPGCVPPAQPRVGRGRPR